MIQNGHTLLFLKTKNNYKCNDKIDPIKIFETFFLTNFNKILPVIILVDLIILKHKKVGLY